MREPNGSFVRLATRRCNARALGPPECSASPMRNEVAGEV